MKSIRVNYKLPPWMDEQLRARSKKRQESLTEYVRKALMERFEREDKEKMWSMNILNQNN